LLMNRGLGIGDWGLGNPQSPIPNPQISMQKNTILIAILILYQ